MAIPDALAQCPLFQRMPPGDCEAVAGLATSERYEDGAFVFRAGEAADALYVIERGTVEAMRDGAVVASLEAGASLGEGPFFVDGTYALDARASGGAQLLRFGYEALHALFAQRPAVGAAFYRSACADVHTRLRQMAGHH